MGAGRPARCYFVSDRDGVSNVYPLRDRTSRELRQVTNVTGGVSGITATSPSLAVASRAGHARVQRLPQRPLRDPHDRRTRAAEARLVPLADDAEPATRLRAAATSADRRTLVPSCSPTRAPGSPDAGTFASTRVRRSAAARVGDRRPTSARRPATGFGGILRASFGVTFGDLLRDRQLQTLVPRRHRSSTTSPRRSAYIEPQGAVELGRDRRLRAVALRRRAPRASRATATLVTRETTPPALPAPVGRVDGALQHEPRRGASSWRPACAAPASSGRRSRASPTRRAKTVSRVLEETAAGPPVYLAETAGRVRARHRRSRADRPGARPAAAPRGRAGARRPDVRRRPRRRAPLLHAGAAGDDRARASSTSAATVPTPAIRG